MCYKAVFFFLEFCMDSEILEYRDTYTSKQTNENIREKHINRKTNKTIHYLFVLTIKT
jgi:hypothetical protein